MGHVWEDYDGIASQVEWAFDGYIRQFFLVSKSGFPQDHQANLSP